MEARIDEVLSTWLPPGYESLVGSGGGLLQPPADVERVVYCVEGVELCRSPPEKELFHGEALNHAHDEPVVGSLVVTDYRTIFVDGFRRDGGGVRRARGRSATRSRTARRTRRPSRARAGCGR